MGKICLVLATACLIFVIRTSGVPHRRQEHIDPGDVGDIGDDGEDFTDDVPAIIMPVDKLMEKYHIQVTDTTFEKRDLVDDLPPGTVIAYVLTATCHYITFWIIDFTNEYADGYMNIKVYTDPLDIPKKWTRVNRDPAFNFGDLLPVFPTNLGEYEPCTTVYIISQLRKKKGRRRLGTFTIDTDCPCDPGSGQGDPHYLTFQGKHIEYNGACSYVLTVTCKDSPHYLKVIARHGPIVNGGTGARRIESASITADGHDIDLLDDGSMVIDKKLISGNDLTPDLAAGAQLVSNKTHIVFSFIAKWWVEWDKNPRNNRNRLFVGIHKDSPLIGTTCGLLGMKTHMGYTGDDLGYQMANGKYTRDQNELGKSWEVPGSCPTSP